jgi:flagellar FliL protein
MAEEKDTKQQKDTEENKEKAKPGLGRFLPWIIAAAVILLCAGIGFALGRIVSGRGPGQIPEPAQQTQLPQTQIPATAESSADSEDTWYYELEPVVANLNEPGVTRYVRVALTLEINSDLPTKKGGPFLDQKKPLLKNWLTLYLANQTLEDIRGETNLKRLQTQISDGFNEKLFPDSRPKIKRVLFKEFAIQ